MMHVTVHSPFFHFTFIALPPPANGENFDPVEDEPALDPAWVHLGFSYLLCLRALYSNTLCAKVAKECISENFALGILKNFDSEDPRERDYAKNILYKVRSSSLLSQSFSLSLSP